MRKQYRTNGAIGALLDEYEKALNELYLVIASLNNKTLCAIVDPNTPDPDCQSIQTILTHIVQSGYTYAVEVLKSIGDSVDYREKEEQKTALAYISALKAMFAYNVAVFDKHPNLQLETYSPAEKIKVRWGQYYDIEQLYEHAIVHVLRHRRQIERYKQILTNQSK